LARDHRANGKEFIVVSEVHKTKFSERKRKIGERDINAERDRALAKKLAPPAEHSKQRVAPAPRARFPEGAKSTLEPLAKSKPRSDRNRL
jgi:hypothetical protein